MSTYKRRGLTLIELLVASTLGLMLVIGVMKAFQEITRSVTRGRAVVKLSEDIRRTTNVLRSDLEGLTVKCIPNLASNEDSGYFELIEGPKNDKNSITLPNKIHDITGDTDDVLMFTSRRMTEPFTGRLTLNPGVTQPIQSNLAEVIYWLAPDPNLHNGLQMYRLHRRVLLIRPDLNKLDGMLGTALSYPEFMNLNDLSIRINPDGTLSANSLADLNLRQNRVAHQSANPGNNGLTDLNFPHRFDHSQLPIHLNELMGEDVILGQAIGFDLRVFDPIAENRLFDPDSDIEGDEVLLSPADFEYGTAGSAVSSGSYVDLGWTLNNRQQGYLRELPDPKSYLASEQFRTYDTWTQRYERDRINQDQDNMIDEGTNGLDDDGENGIDDPGESETQPPYNVPLRGIQVIIRAFETGQQQLRQATVSHNFTSE